jgi:hypothetical protein
MISMAPSQAQTAPQQTASADTLKQIDALQKQIDGRCHDNLTP